MGNKDVVKRLTENESALIDVIRRYKESDVETIFDTMLVDLKDAQSRAFVIELMGAYSETPKLSLNDLENLGKLDVGVRNKILKAIDDKRNIMIVGQVGAGKTTLAGSIMSEFTNTNFMVGDKFKRIHSILREKAFKGNEYYWCPKLYVDDVIGNVRYVDRFVFDELTNSSNVMALTTALSLGKTVLATSCCTDGGLIEYLNNFSPKHLKVINAKVLIEANFFIIKVIRDFEGNSFKATVIAE